jgi:hypothetical protein
LTTFSATTMISARIAALVCGRSSSPSSRRDRAWSFTPVA